MKLEQLKIEINKNDVFHMIDCYEESPVYETIVENYEELLPKVVACSEGKCMFELGKLKGTDATTDYPEGTKVIYAVSTVGKTVSRLSNEMFLQGEYIKGMLANAMADSALFELEKQWMPALRMFCENHHLGICARLEAPNDLLMTVQKTALEILNVDNEMEIAITEGLMYDPPKSSCIVFVVIENSCLFQAKHDCSNCKTVGCKMRKQVI